MKLLIAFTLLSVIAAAHGAAITTYPLAPTTATDGSQVVYDVPIEPIPQIRFGGSHLGGLPLLGGSNILGGLPLLGGSNFLGGSLLGGSSLPWGGGNPGAIYGGGLLNNNFLPVQVSIPNILSSLLVNI